MRSWDLHGLEHKILAAVTDQKTASSYCQYVAEQQPVDQSWNRVLLSTIPAKVCDIAN